METVKEYIERETFLTQERERYCKDCARRRGMRNGKYKTLYEIGEAPCRACEIGDALNDVEDFPAADVVPWETLMRYAEYFCRDVPYTEFIRAAKMLYDGTKAAMDGGNIE